MTKFASLKTSLKLFPPVQKPSLSKEIFKEDFDDDDMVAVFRLLLMTVTIL